MNSVRERQPMKFFPDSFKYALGTIITRYDPGNAYGLREAAGAHSKNRYLNTYLNGYFYASLRDAEGVNVWWEIEPVAARVTAFR